MTKIANIIIKDNVHVKIDGLEVEDYTNLSNQFSVFVPGAFYTPQFKLGVWDGYKRFFDINGKTYLAFIDKIVEYLITNGYDITLDDARKVLPNPMKRATVDQFSHLVGYGGKPIEMRPYQVDAVNAMVETGRGVGLSATGSGKCHHEDTFVTIKCTDVTFCHKLNIPIGVETNIAIGHLCKSLNEFNINMRFSYGYLYPCDIDLFVKGSSEKCFVKINGYLKKRATMYRITFDDGTFNVCADSHKFVSYENEKENTVLAKRLSIGNYVEHISGVAKKVKSITIGEVGDVYDISIEDSSHIYSTSNGILHHNTSICASICDIYGSSGYRILIIVPSSDLVDQTHKTLKMFGLNAGIYSGDLKQNGGFDHIVATWQALQYNPFMVSTTSLPDSNGNRTSFDGFITDEVQGMKSEVLSTLSSDYGKHLPFRFGITGTLPKPADEEMSILSSLGDILFRITTKWLIDNGYLADLEIEMIVTQEGKKESFPDYASEKSWVSKNNDRLSLIAHDIINHTKVYGNTFVLVDSIEQGKILESLIPDSVFMWGDTKKGIRQSKYADFDTMNGLTVIANMPIASTGISIDRIFCLCLIDSGKSFVRTIQSIGRGLRLAHDKKIVFIKDYSSSLKYGSKHRKERLKWYDEQEYDKITTRKLK